MIRALEHLGLAELIEGIPGVVWMASGDPDDPRQRIDFVSPYVEKMLGYSVQEWLSTPNFWLTIVHPDDREHAVAVAADAYAKGLSHTNQFRWMAKDGRTLWVESHASVVRDDAGSPIGMRGVTFDISARRRVEEELRQSQRLIVDTPFMLTRCSRDLRYVFVSPAYARMLGREPGDLQGRSISEVMGPEGFATIAPHVNQVLGGDRVEYETDVNFSGVGTRRLHVVYTPDVGLEGRVDGWIASIVDITDARRAEAERLRLVEENATITESVGQLKDEFLASFSHELRTPLNAILGYARLLRAGVMTDDKHDRAIETIERNATSLAQIVEDVLDVSRIVSGKMRLNVQPVDVPQIVRNSIDAVSVAAEAKGVRIETVLDPQAGVVSGDPERLQQVLWNVLSNAVKFTGRGGKVQVRLGRVDSHIEASIADTGIGISPEFLPHVFERFRQADSGIARERSGLGLGLSIARQLIEMHGGTIEAASAGVGQGSTFRVKLPDMIAYPPSGTSERLHPRASMDIAGDLHGVHVLVVDDDADGVTLVSELLAAAGARVSAAASAAEALRILDGEVPDVVVSDLGMPVIDGFQLIERIRGHRSPAVRRLPAAALTAYARSEDRVKALRAGFQIHLAKPIDPRELVTTVAALASRFSAMHNP